MVRNRRRSEAPKTPKWFQNIPLESPKWVCSLHPSINLIRENLQSLQASPGNHCCPHVYGRITQEENNNFVIFQMNGHNLIKSFEPSIAALLGSDLDPNKYELASKDFQSSDYLEIERIKPYKIIQPLDLAVQLAHKLGFEGSFKRYDEIILSLAKKAENQITDQHGKIFDRYEKCRNLALGTSELGERSTAMEMAYSNGRKLIASLCEVMKPPASQGKCKHCGQVLTWQDRDYGDDCCLNCWGRINN